MEKGLTAQLTKRVTPIPFQCSFTWCRAPKSTFINMGMIITQISRPTGMLTSATSSRPKYWKGAGIHWPSAMPARMQSPTHRVSQRSKRLMGAPAACLIETSHCADMG